jgi:hypothetical protein
MARKLEKELVEYIDSKLKDNAIAQNAIEDKDCRTLLVEVAKCLVGIREKTGRNDGKLVELIQKTSGGRKGHAWCMFFVQTCIGYVELKTGLKSRIKSSGSCASVRLASTPDMKVKSIPLPGAIILWIHANGNGHTGIAVAADEENFFACEGNTTGGLDEQGNIEREGGGAYYTKRSMNPTGEMNLWGFLKPCFE